MILKTIRKSLTLKWMVLLALLAVISLIFACLSILQIYHEDLKRSFIAVEGIVLILGILFIFFLTKKVILPIKRMSKGLKEELVKRTRELEVLNEIGALINQNLGSLDTVFPITVEKVANLTGYEMGALFLLNEVGDILEMKSQIGHSPAMLKEVKVLKFSEGVSGEAIRLKQPVIVSVSEYPSARIVPILRGEGVQTVVGIPLMAKGKAIGAIILSSRSPRKLSPREVNSLESIGNQIGIALENTKLFSTIAKAKSEWETTFDAVTDLITIRDKDYRIIRANTSAFKRFGLRPEEMIGKRCFETLHQSNKPCEGCYVTEVLKTKKPASGERDSKYLNGIFQYFVFPVYDEAGEVVAVVDLAREITEEKRMQMEKEVVNHVNRILASSLDLKQGIRSVYAELKKVLDCERMTVALFDEGGKGFRYFALEKDYEAGELVGDILYPLQGTHFERMAERGEPEIIDNAEGDSWIGQKLLQEEGIRSVLLFPLEYKGKIFGTVNFGSTKPKHFSEAQFNLLRQISVGLAIFIQNILLFRETKKRLEELTILHEITKISTSASLNMDQMLRKIVDNKDLFKSEYLDIFLIEENTKRLIHRTSDKSHRRNIEYIEALGLCLGKGITGWVAEKGEPLLVNDVKKDPRYIFGDESICSEICAPLKVGQKVIGVIDAQSRELNAFSQNDLRLLNIAAGQIATLIENNRLQEEIRNSEEKYRTVVENAIDGVCVIGKDHLFKYANERLAEIHGYRREELIGTDIRNFFDEESRALLADREDKRARGIKLSPHFELNFLHKDGGTRNAEISASAIKDSKGDVNTVVFVKDITERKQAEVALRQSEGMTRRLSQENATVAEIGRIISSTLNIEEVYERFAEKARKLIPFDRIMINLTDLKNNTINTAYITGVDVPDQKAGNISPMTGTATEEVVRTRSTLVIQGDNIDEAASRFPRLLLTFKAGFRSMIFVPLISKDQVIGVLSFRSLVPKAYTDQDVRLAESIGNQIAGAIANSQLFIERKQAEEAAKRLSQENATVAEIGRIISLTLNIEEVYERFAEEVRKLIPFDRIVVTTINPDHHSGTMAYVLGVEVEDRNQGAVFPLAGSFYEEIFSKQSGILVQTEDESELGERYPILLSTFQVGLRSMISVPLISKGQVIGVLHIRSLKPNAYTELDLKLAERVGNQIAGAIANAQLFTERKQAEEALRENENRLQALLDASPIGISWADMDGNIKYVNRKFVQLFGYTVNDIPNIAEWRRLAYPDPAYRDTVPSLIAKLTEAQKQGREIRPVEMTIKCKDGLTRYVEQTGTFVSDRILAIYNDLTERKQMEEALRESENKFRSLVENSIVGVYLIQEGIFKYGNARFAEIHGYEIEEMVGKMGATQTIFPEDLSIVAGNIDKRMRGEEESMHYEFRIVTKTQEIRYGEVFGSRTIYQGKPAVIGTMLDITDRKKAEEALRQSEEKYRTILESIEDGYYEVDLAGNQTFFNDSLCRIYGYPKEEVTGVNYRRFTDQENAEKLFQTFNRVYRTGEPGKVFDWEIIRKDGTRRHVEASVSLQKDTSGKAIGFRGILRDVTEKKKAEEQLLQTEKLRAVGEMASGVAHDFNNALAAILGNTQLLLYTTHDEELKETLKIIEKVAKDSSQTIRRLQDFTRKRVDQELFKVNINAIIKDSMEMTKPKWKDEPQSKGIRIEMVSNLKEIPSVSGNASELREVITNMIFNAIEAMPEGGKIEICTFKKGRNVFIQISDSGIGIAEEAERKIFEPFFTTKPFTNTGLGLSMSYGIIKRFGGEIEVESKVGQGTTFTIILPIGGEEKEEAVSPQPTKKGREARILVIDDDEFVRNVLSRTFAQANHQVTLAESGEKGIELFKKGKFDIVLTDLGMPGMSGWEVCRGIKEISPHTPVGMITGWGVEKNRNEVEECGLDFFISKPFDFNQILNVISETMTFKEE